jgi:hypothetical protein
MYNHIFEITPFKRNYDAAFGRVSRSYTTKE